MKKIDPEHQMVNTRREFGEHGGVCPSISRSSTFTVIHPHTMPEIFHGIRGPEEGGCFLYSRHFNPTNDVLARYLAALEGSEHAICTASGMSAICCAISQICKQGDHVISSDTIYGGTHALFSDIFPDMGIEVTFVDPTRMDEVKAAIKPNTKVLYTEVVGNPTLKVADIRGMAELSHNNGMKLIVDNTFTPVIVSPLSLGADVVVHSMTKFINGASDLVAGAICADKEFILQLMDLHVGRVMLFGPTMDPRVAFDIIQRLPSLPLRMREHSRRALAMAERLEELGAPVSYPGLISHPQYELTTSMLNERCGYGGMLTIDCGTQQKGEHLMDILQNEEKFGLIAVSLGYFDTLMSCSGSSTSSEISAEEQQRMGLSPGLIRISVGYTGSMASRIKQLENGLRTAGII